MATEAMGLAVKPWEWGGSPGAPLIYFKDGGGGPSDFFGSEILAQRDFFWVYERCQYIFGSQKKPEGFFWVAKKGHGDFFGYAKKHSDSFG